MLKQANSKESVFEYHPPLSALVHLPLNRNVCQFDASWHVDDTLRGHGWVQVDQDNVLHLDMIDHLGGSI